MNSGKKVFVICTDEGSFDDFKYFCEHSGHKLLVREKTENDFIIHTNSSEYSKDIKNWFK